MKCPYPDCQGEVSEGEQFCGECGRSLAPEAVAAAKAGMATNPLTTSSLPAPPPLTQPMPPITPASPPVAPMVAPPMTAPVARSNNMLPWLVIGGLGVMALTVLCCLGFAIIGSTPDATPTAVAQNIALTFDLNELTADNDFQMDKEVRAADGSKLGVVSAKAGYSYATLGSPELMGTVEIRVNNKVALELAASTEPKYAETNPEFEVAEQGRTYTGATQDNLQLTVTVDSVAIQEQPTLQDGTPGEQPVFTTLHLTVAVATGP
jgi:hypothetical protein